MTRKILILLPLIVRTSQDDFGKFGKNSAKILEQDDPDRSEAIRARDTLSRDHDPPPEPRTIQRAALAALIATRIAGYRARSGRADHRAGQDLPCRFQQPPPSTECCSWRIGGIHGRGGKYHRVRGVTGAAFEDLGVSYRCEPQT